MNFTRRAFLASTSALAVLRASGTSAQAEPFSRETVVQMARDLAESSYEERSTVPDPWLNLSYEQYKSLWFRPTEALWAGTDTPYEVDFFAPGLYYRQAIQVDAVENGVDMPVPFDLSKFDKTDKVPDLPGDETMGYSGLRLRTELTQAGKKNEFCVFQGASYFRAIGYGMNYGLSGRGLALKTGDPEGEEFPNFTRFWLERPKEGQKNIVVHALLDSPSVTGAYRFDISPGPDCVMEVQATLFTRTELDHVGLGPLTSMFLFDATNSVRFDDFRPAVHDNDGLMIWNGAGEVLWRPLANPKKLQISSFLDQMPKGFGLMQRSRKFSDFSDLEALYHKRPGVWVEPRGDWGPGAVTLVEIPSDKEIYDNIVAYWRPRDPIPEGGRVDVAYRLTWCVEAPVRSGLSQVLNTRIGAAHDWSEHPDGRIVAIDFEEHPLFEEELEQIDIKVSSPSATTTQGVVQRNPETGGVRLVFAFDPGESELVELRAQLRRDGAPATEVWLYRWTK